MTIFIQILLLLLSIFLIYYVKQKGKTQADKEDLRELTVIVEEVKSKKYEELELLKANLFLLTDREKQIYTEEKQAIIDFYAQLNTWIWDRLNIYIDEYNYTNYHDIYTRLTEMRHAYNQTNIIFSKVQLITTNKDLLKSGHDAILKTLELHHFKEGLLKRLSSTLSWEKIFLDQVVNKEVDFAKLKSDFHDFYKQQAEQHKKEKKEIVNEYFTKHNEIFNPAIRELNKFNEKAKEYLRQNK